MPLDIAAIQYIYGANMSFHTGNDIYALTNNGVVSTIWDAGGTDTLDASPLGFGTTINLNAGSIMMTGTSGAITAIAYNVTIENAIGSGGNDTIYGNNADNVINGGAGNDTMAGGVGNDTYVVDNIFDVVIENASAGTDLIITNSSTYGLPNNVENITIGPNGIAAVGNEMANTMIGNAIGNTLNGQSGDDFIDGGPGGDVMVGGPGNDTYVVDNGADVLSEVLNDGIDAALSSISYVLPANVENLTLTGNLNLSGTGNSLDNILTSNSGIDTLTGGLGNDTYFLNNPADVVIENPNAGIDTVVAGFSYSLVGTNLENVTLIGGANLTVMGNGFNNFLTSNSGVNTLTGGLGNDIYVLNNAVDTVVENPGEGIDTLMASFSYSLGVGSNLENVTLFGTDSINATGDGLNNVITGNSAPNILIGSLGNDTLTGGNALDTARFSGLMSSYTITHTGASGTVTGPDGVDTFSSVERLQFDDQTLLFVAPKNDFGGDNQSDVLWHNTNGQLAL
jgi:Ca2+-binding RTX toxin-like protein